MRKSLIASTAVLAALGLAACQTGGGPCMLWHIR